MTQSKTDNVLRCSFCHKTQDQVAKLVSSPDDKFGRAYICNDCVEVCQSILEGEEKGGLNVPTTIQQQSIAQKFTTIAVVISAGALIIFVAIVISNWLRH